MRAIAVPCVSIQSCWVTDWEGGLAGDDGDHRRIECEWDLFWGGRSDKRVGENALSGIA